MIDDSLLSLSRAPAFVEEALRAALAEMISVRRAFGAACDVREFTKLALVRSRFIDAGDERPDLLARHERESAVVRTAAYFAASALGRRLRALPVERLAIAPAGFDVAVRDRHRGLHYVRLETYLGSDARLAAVTRNVRAIERMSPEARPSLHFFSLRDGTLRSYPAVPARSRRIVPASVVAAA